MRKGFFIIFLLDGGNYSSQKMGNHHFGRFILGYLYGSAIQCHVVVALVECSRIPCLQNENLQLWVREI